METEFLIFVCIMLAIIVLAIFYYYPKDKKEYETNLKNFLQKKNFILSKRITISNLIGSLEFVIDDVNEQFAIYSSLQVPFQANKIEFRKFNYKDLIKFELEEHKDYKISGNMGSAIAGSLLLGFSGAIIGSAGSKTMTETNNIEIVNLYMNDINIPLVSINCSYSFGTAKEIIATLTAIKNKNDIR